MRTASRFETRTLMHKGLLSSFRAPIRHAVGYGSRIMKQSEDFEQPDTRKQADFIFATTHAAHFHDVNLEQHPSHYSFLRHFGSGLISTVQSSGAGAYYNTYCTSPHINTAFKYGIVTIDDLCQDLLQWNTFFFAGRFQKPMLTYKHDLRVSIANQANLISALRLAVLHHLHLERCAGEPPRAGWGEWIEIPFSTVAHTIAGFSYTADYRTRLRVDTSKVDSMLAHQLVFFKNLYYPVIRHCLYDAVKVSGDRLLCRADPPILARHLLALPRHFQYKLVRKFVKSGGEAVHTDGQLNYQATAQAIIAHPDLPSLASKALQSIGHEPALVETVKGVVTAGPVKSIRYLAQKLRKRV